MFEEHVDGIRLIKKAIMAPKVPSFSVSLRFQLLLTLQFNEVIEDTKIRTGFDGGFVNGVAQNHDHHWKYEVIQFHSEIRLSHR
jgi:hypothetical protein